MTEPRPFVGGAGLTRRQLLAAAGKGGLGLAAVAVVGCRSSAKPSVRTFSSRPDLRPPVVTVTRRDLGLAPGLLFLTLRGPLIIDDHGEPVWYRPLQGKGSSALQVQQYLGEPVLTWWEGKNQPTFGRGEWVIVDRSYRELRRVQAGNGYSADFHDLVLTPAGTALLMAYVPVTADLRSVSGPASGPIFDCVIQEIDLATNRVVFEWHARDHVALDESYTHFSASGTFDFFHANSIEVDRDGNLLVSARNTWTVYKVERPSGKVLWRLGGKKSDFSMGSGLRFAWQHDARRQADGTITLFDNGATPKVAEESRGLVLRVDERARTASLVRQYTRPNLLSNSQGDLQLLPNGNALVGWGMLPNVSEFDAAGKLVFDAHFPEKVQSYRAFRLAWHGRPTDPPAVKAVRRSGGGLRVRASWNGATDVARWELIGGSIAATLHPLASVPRRGFETEITTPRDAPWVVVRALDVAGSELGRSAPVRAS